MDKEKEIQGRVDEFKKEYQELIKKYEVDLASYPMFVPRKDGTFGIAVSVQVVDTKYRPAPSPLQEEDIIKK